MADEGQLLSLIEQLERKIGLLTNMYGDAKRQIQRLEGEKEDVSKRLREQQDLAKQLQKKLGDLEKNTAKSKDFGKLVKDNLSGTDTNAELKQQLDEYIRELERYIAHLSSLS